MHHRVLANLGLPVIEFNLRWQVPIDKEVGRLKEGGVFRKNFDRISPVAKDAGIAIDVCDGRRARSSIHEADVERDSTGVLHEGADT